MVPDRVLSVTHASQTDCTGHHWMDRAKPICPLNFYPCCDHGYHAKQICAIVFAYAKCWFSHDAAPILFACPVIFYGEILPICEQVPYQSDKQRSHLHMALAVGGMLNPKSIILHSHVKCQQR